MVYCNGTMLQSSLNNYSDGVFQVGALMGCFMGLLRECVNGVFRIYQNSINFVCKSPNCYVNSRQLITKTKMSRVCREIRSRLINRDERRKTITRGRPRGTKRQTTQNPTQNPSENPTESLQQRQPLQEQTFQTFVKFMYLFARLGNVALRSILKKNKKNSKLFKFSRKFYMLSEEPKASYTFSQDGSLVDTSQYEQITQVSSVQGIQLPLKRIQKKQHEFNEQNEFLVLINKILRELDDVFIDEFLKILEYYLENKENEQFVEELFIYVLDENNFPYLSSWRQDKLKTYQIKLQIEKAEFLEKCDKINLKIHDGVVAKKLNNFIDANIHKLEEEENSDPLKFFLQKLVQLFGEGLGNQKINQDLDNSINNQQDVYRFCEEFFMD